MARKSVPSHRRGTIDIESLNLAAERFVSELLTGWEIYTYSRNQEQAASDAAALLCLAVGQFVCAQPVLCLTELRLS